MKNMKITQISVLILSAASLVSCASYKTVQNKVANSYRTARGKVSNSYNSSPGSGSNPLNPAGAVKTSATKAKPSATFAPGIFLVTKSANTALFSRFPARSDQPIKTLATNTDVKVISSKVSYTKVEVVKTGQVGFVPTVSLGKKIKAKAVAKSKPATKPKSYPVAKAPVVSNPITEIKPLDVNNTAIPPLPAPASRIEPILPTKSPFSVVEDLPSIAPRTIIPTNNVIPAPEIINPLLPAE